MVKILHTFPAKKQHKWNILISLVHFPDSKSIDHASICVTSYIFKNYGISYILFSCINTPLYKFYVHTLHLYLGYLSVYEWCVSSAQDTYKQEACVNPMIKDKAICICRETYSLIFRTSVSALLDFCFLHRYNLTVWPNLSVYVTLRILLGFTPIRKGRI